MTNVLILAAVAPDGREGEPVVFTPAQSLLRKRVLDSVVSPHSKRNYAKALDDLFAFCASRPLSRSLLMEWRAGMDSLSPSTINVRLSAVRKLVGEARRAGMIGQEEAAIFADNVIASAILDRLLHHSTTINIKGESYRLKDKKKAGVVAAKLPGKEGG